MSKGPFTIRTISSPFYLSMTSTDDCKQVLIRMQRKKTGPFTFIEDRALVDAVYEVMNLRGKYCFMNLPSITFTYLPSFLTWLMCGF